MIKLVDMRFQKSLFSFASVGHETIFSPTLSWAILSLDPIRQRYFPCWSHTQTLKLRSLRDKRVGSTIPNLVLSYSMSWRSRIVDAMKIKRKVQRSIAPLFKPNPGRKNSSRGLGSFRFSVNKARVKVEATMNRPLVEVAMVLNFNGWYSFFFTN